MKCLVVGAAGFIGDALIRRLVKEGHSVTGFIHRHRPKHEEKSVAYVMGDITNIESLKTAVNAVDIVFHCAALVKDYGSKKAFYKINVEGTKNLVSVCKDCGVNRFIFISRIKGESSEMKRYYCVTKALAENYLIESYKNDRFPVVIIRPGNVYGPGATTWVLRPLQAIKKNRIALINEGKGIFLHTYIDNLLDALVAAMEVPGALGKTIEVTDGDNSTTWEDYLNELARISGKKAIKKTISKKTAIVLSNLMMILYRLFKIEPWVTPLAVEMFTHKKKIAIDNAKEILGYSPQIDFKTGMIRVSNWLRQEGYIT